MQVEHDPVFSAPRKVVQSDAQVLQHGLVTRELSRFVVLNEAVGFEIAPAPTDAGRPGYPLDDVQVAQATGCFLQIRLEGVGGILMFCMALLLLQFLRLVEGSRIEVLPQGGLELVL